jgi:hypothetical protein
MENEVILSYNLVKHLHRQMEFSFKTFGPPRCKPEGHPTDGVQDHIAKELVEVAANPNDVEEWIDLVILAFDGALRAGYTPEQIVDTLLYKQIKNEGRKWPAWQDREPGKAIEHIRT